MLFFLVLRYRLRTFTASNGHHSVKTEGTSGKNWNRPWFPNIKKTEVGAIHLLKELHLPGYI